MDILIAGGHGTIGGLLAPRFAADGYRVLSTVRKAEQRDEVAGEGIEPVILDVTGDVTSQLDAAGVTSVDAVVFTIGAGPGSGPEKKQTIDRDGAIKLADWAEAREVARFVLVSSHGAHDPTIADGDFGAYLEAKRDADDHLATTGLNWTIVRPGALTDHEGTGLVAMPDPEHGGGEIPRDDVAAFLRDVTLRDDLSGVITELTSGDLATEVAAERLAASVAD